jgi:hypothetical protein
MKFEVVFEIEKAKGCCPAVEEVVKMNCCSGTPLQGLFWRDVKRILKRRATVHPLVKKWAEGKENLGIRVDVYKMVQRRRWRYGKWL